MELNSKDKSKEYPNILGSMTNDALSSWHENSFFFFSFNAVVSKSINKHGDHAFSVYGQRREFGSGVKINHYFPGKNYFFQENKRTENKEESKPVKEAAQELFKPVESKPTQLEDKEKTQSTRLESEVASEMNTPVLKVETVEPAPVKIIPTVLSMIVQNNDKSTSDSVVMMPVVEDLNTAPTEKPVTDDVIKANPEPVLDSDAASSYYHHSRIYYVGFWKTYPLSLSSFVI